MLKEKAAIVEDVEGRTILSKQVGRQNIKSDYPST